jgi:hypothetical protein
VYAWTLRGYFHFDSPPKSVSKGARFWGFLGSSVRGVLGGISSIPLDLESFSGPKLGYGVPMRCSYYPKVLHKSVERFGRSGVGFWGVDPRALFIPRALVTPAWLVPHTGLTGADSLLSFVRVNVLVSSLLSRVATVSSTTWKTRFGNGCRSPLVTGNAPVTDQVLQITQER